MTISKIDLICLVFILIFAFRGYKKGAIGSLINLVGLVASFVIAWISTPWLTEKIMELSIVRSGLMAWIGNVGTDQDAILKASSRMIEMGIFALIVMIVIVIVQKIKKRMEKSEKFALIGAIDKVIGILLGILTAAILITAIIGIVYMAAGYLGKTDTQQALTGSSFLTLFIAIMK